MTVNLVFEKSSTDRALVYLADCIRKTMGNGLFKGMVIWDLQEVLDTINHTMSTIWERSVLG